MNYLLVSMKPVSVWSLFQCFDALLYNKIVMRDYFRLEVEIDVTKDLTFKTTLLKFLNYKSMSYIT